MTVRKKPLMSLAETKSYTAKICHPIHRFLEERRIVPKVLIGKKLVQKDTKKCPGNVLEHK